MNTCLSCALCAWLGLVAQTGWGWSKDYQTQYLLGDNDSRLNARQIALAQIQLQATQEAGAYVQGATTLVNEQLQERISQVGVALVSVEVLSEQFELTASGQQRLVLHARAQVDEAQRPDWPAAPARVPTPAPIPASAPAARAVPPQAVTGMSPGPTATPAARPPHDDGRRQAASVLPARSPQPGAPASSAPAPGYPSSPAIPDPAAASGWPKLLSTALLQTPVQVRLVSRALSADGQSYALTLRVDWRLDLANGNPLADLCRQWNCTLGYAYRAPFNDARLTPLHQQLFRPLSRLALMQDKYLSHWQLLTLYAAPPTSAGGAPQAGTTSDYRTRLAVRTTVADQSFDLPLLQMRDTPGEGMIIALQGMVDKPELTPYDTGSGAGDLACAMTFYQQECTGLVLSQFALRTVQVPIAVLRQHPHIDAQVIAL